jgi:serine/threonine protein kinase
MGLAKNFAKAGLSGMTATGSFGGSFPFMPREQVTKYKYMRPVSDVWSIGATFYYLLTGQFPRDLARDQDPIEVILKDILVPIRKRDSTIPSRVAEVIDRSLSNNPNDRYTNADEMLLALEKAL